MLGARNPGARRRLDFGQISHLYFVLVETKPWFTGRQNMAKHVKPTKEELDKGIKDSLEELDTLEPPVIPEPDPDPEPTPDTDPTPGPDPKDESKPEDVSPDEDQRREEELKKKLTNSAREAQVLHARTKKMDEAVDEAGGIPEPTDEDMKGEYPDWDLMDDVTKKLAKDSRVNKRRFELIHKAAKEGKDIEAWNTKVDEFVADPKSLNDFPALEGKEEDFKVFAVKPTRRGLDFPDLVSAFLYDVNKASPLPSKGKMFETGTGGPNERIKPKSDKISLAEARVLMKTDYKKYKEYLISGKIDTSTI